MNTVGKIWGLPGVIGAATCVGLVGALLMEGGVAQTAACAALAVPVAAAAWAFLFKR